MGMLVANRKRERAREQLMVQGYLPKESDVTQERQHLIDDDFKVF